MVVAVAVAVTLILTLGGGSDPKPDPQADPTATETSEPTPTDSPTTSAGPSDAAASASTSEEYDDLLSSDAMVSYLQPVYDDLQSCSKDPADNGYISCDLGDDRLLIIMDTDTDAYENDAVPNFLNGAQSSDWAPGSYNQTTWTSPDGDHSGAFVTAKYADTASPIIYWERDGELAAALGIKSNSGTVASPEDLQAMWEDLFNH